MKFLSKLKLVTVVFKHILQWQTSVIKAVMMEKLVVINSTRPSKCAI